MRLKNKNKRDKLKEKQELKQGPNKNNRQDNNNNKHKAIIFHKIMMTITTIILLKRIFKLTEIKIIYKISKTNKGIIIKTDQIKFLITILILATSTITTMMESALTILNSKIT